MSKQATQKRKRPVQNGDPPKGQVAMPANILLADLSRLTLEGAAELCRQQPQAAANMIISLLHQRTASLPDTVFVRREDGCIKRYQVSLRLSESEGHLIRIRRKVGRDWMTAWDYSITGLRKVNEIPALQIIKPREIAVGGKTQMNPYIEIDDRSRMPTVVYARCLAIGYSTMGSLVATDVMVRLDINIYLIENLQSKLDKLENNADKLAQYGTADTPPDSIEGQRARWTFMPTHSVGGIGLWVNMAHPAFMEVMGDHTTRMKFIERLAQSFAERNALKAHPAIPKTINAENGAAAVKVTGWTTEFNRQEIEALRLLVEKDRLHEFKAKGAEKGVEVHSVTVETMDDADRESLEHEVSSEQGHERKELNEGDEDEEQATEGSGPMNEALGLFGQLSEMLGRDAAKKMVADAGIASLEEATEEELGAFIERARQAMEG